MKKPVLLLLVVATLSGCNDWLDVRPKTEIRGKDLFKSEQGFWDALTGIYIGMTDQSIYGANLSWGAIEFMAWQHASYNENATWYNLQRFDYESQTTLSFVNNAWGKMYNVISEINELLHMLDEMGHVLSEVAYNTIKGEALALRAYCHFDLMRLFAEGNLANNPAALNKLCIPYVTIHSKNITPQKSYRETLVMLMNDANEAITFLEKVPLPNGTYFTMNHLAARALRMRIAQWAYDPYTVSYAIDVIERITEENQQIQWVSTFTTARENRTFPSELLFCLDVFGLRRLTENSYTSHVHGYPNLNMLINTDDFITNDLFELGQHPFGVSTADYRYLHWFESNRSDMPSLSGRLSVKVQQPPIPNLPHNIVPLMRISEPYLVIAESLIGFDNTTVTELINYLRMVRGNPSGVEDDVPLGLSDDMLRYIVQQEYRREFTQEGQLFFYYKRKGVERMPGSPVALGEMTNERYRLPYPIAEQEFGRIQQ
jgi:hypothetical protein